MTYTTRQGEMWDEISYNQLGSCRFTEALINANRKYVETFIFPANVELILPDVEEEIKVPKLPPWRK